MDNTSKKTFINPMLNFKHCHDFWQEKQLARRPLCLQTKFYSGINTRPNMSAIKKIPVEIFDRKKIFL
ncbi:MAG: hypothetical protein IJQ85_03335 [Selenomonadaceae bacterium]|nr:hypothetical protein [Selenomonadaceae bacterium]